MITAIYASLLAFLLVFLSGRSVRLRQRFQVGIGAGGEPVLRRALRAHGNFTEYVPLALLLMYFLELRIDTQQPLHALGVLLLVGRCVHAFGLSQVKEDLRFRTAGMVMTFTTIVVAAVWNLVLAATAA